MAWKNIMFVLIQDHTPPLVYHLRLYALVLLTFGMLVTESTCSHVTETSGSCAAAEGQQVAVVRVKFCHCDHLTQILHVFWLQIYNI